MAASKSMLLFLLVLLVVSHAQARAGSYPSKRISTITNLGRRLPRAPPSPMMAPPKQLDCPPRLLPPLASPPCSSSAAPPPPPPPPPY
ncbi:unnamed protein product [Musa acuminata var. zebrina]